MITTVSLPRTRKAHSWLLAYSFSVIGDTVTPSIIQQAHGPAGIGEEVLAWCVIGAGFYGLVKCLDWVNEWKQRADTDGEDSDKKFRRRVRHLVEDDIPSLPDVPETDPDPPSPIPDLSVFRRGARALKAQKALDEKLLVAMLKSEERKKGADPRSANPIESLAACFADPTQAEGLRDWWETLLRFEKSDARRLVREEMGCYGVKWPEEGNPFAGK